MSKKAWIIFSAICVALIGGLVFVSNKEKIDVSKVDVNAVQSSSEQSSGIADQVFGKADSKVVLIEYGDFQCPGCGAAHPTVKKVTEKYQGQIAFVFRNFPLVSKHPNARAAAAAAEAAGLQGKYWDMHNKLFENQRSWESLSVNERTDFFIGYAKEFKMDLEKFKTDMASEKVNKKISFDQAIGKKAKVDATPTFFLNGEKPNSAINTNGSIDEEKLDQAIADALKQKGIEMPAVAE